MSKPVRLGVLEAHVMDVLWDSGPSTIREIIAHLQSASAYTTIATVLTNLEKKGMVSRERSKNCTRYLPDVTRAEHEAGQMAGVLQGSRDRASSILHFVETMPAEDLALLRDYLQSRDTEGGT